MPILKGIKYVRGYMSLTVTGDFPERFVNLAARTGVSLWDIKRVDDTTMTMSTLAKDYPHLPELAQRASVKLEINEKQGVRFVASRYRKRYAFALGALIMAALIFIMSELLWTIEVTGNETVAADTIVESLERNGFKIGVFLRFVDLHMLENSVMLEIPELSWIAVNLKGSKAFVEVRERIPPPDITVPTAPGDIIAAADGHIINIETYEGEARVTVGTTVKKGDLLIAGTLDNWTGLRLVRSSAKIDAIMSRTFEAVSPKYKEQTFMTGEYQDKRHVEILGLRINLFINAETKYESYDKIVEKKEVVAPGETYLPIALVTTRYYETVKLTVEVPEDEQEADLVSQLDTFRERFSTEVEITDERAEYEFRDGDMYLRVIFEYIGEIGEFVEFK